MLVLDSGTRQAFARLGTDLVLAPASPRAARYALDVETDKAGRERFLLRATARSPRDLAVLQTDRERRHLLLLVRDQTHSGAVECHRYLCGHDERHWFVAAVPNNQAAPTTIRAAMEALQPPAVRNAALAVRAKDRQRRHNRGYVRQGEWFFVPADSARIDERLVLRHEPLRRGRGKAHWAAELIRSGGETVYVSRRHPTGVSEERYRELLSSDHSANRSDWRVMRINPEVYVRGRVSHPDHATVVLRGWHRVYLSNEGAAPWSVAVAFLD